MRITEEEIKLLKAVAEHPGGFLEYLEKIGLLDSFKKAMENK